VIAVSDGLNTHRPGQGSLRKPVPGTANIGITRSIDDADPEDPPPLKAADVRPVVACCQQTATRASGRDRSE
jgi:hypothetical protein